MKMGRRRRCDVGEASSLCTPGKKQSGDARLRGLAGEHRFILVRWLAKLTALILTPWLYNFSERDNLRA